MSYRRTKWSEVAELLGYTSEDTARKIFDESLKSQSPMPIVIDRRQVFIDDEKFAAWKQRRFERLYKEQLASAGG